MPPTTQRIARLVVALLLVLYGCSDDPASNGLDEDPINDRVEHANGIYLPESCDTSPTSIVLVGQLDLPERLSDVWAYYDADADREYALAGFQPGETSQGGLYVIDVTNPADPTLVATLEEAAVNDVASWRHYAYTVTGHAGEDDVGIVYDLSDPTSPVEVGSFASAHNLFVSDRGYLYTAQPGVEAYDLVPDPTTPQPIWNDGRDHGHDIAVTGDTLLDFHGFDGTFVYDNADPLAPDPLRSLDNDSVRFHHSGWLSPNGEYLYINDELPSNLNQRPDISIWDLATGQMIGTFRDTTSTVHNSYGLCDRLVVSYYAKGLVLFDMSDPTRLVLLDGYDTDPDAVGEGVFLGAWGVFPYTRSGHVLVSDVENGLFVFRLE